VKFCEYLRNEQCAVYYFTVHICETPVKIKTVHLEKPSFAINYLPVFDFMQQFIAYVLNINNERMPIANVTLSLYKRLCSLLPGRAMIK
jgi:hypothetical protein